MFNIFAITSLLMLIFTQNATADDRESHFFENIKCQLNPPGDGSTSIEITYDPTTNQNLGRVGSAVVKINTGISGLVGIGRAMGLKNVYRAELSFSGAAGQVGNYITQSKNDPFLVDVKLGFLQVQARDNKGNRFKAKSYINRFQLTRVQEEYLGNNYKTETRSFIELKIISDFGTFTQRFDEKKECKIIL